MSKLRGLSKEHGQALAEYGLLLALLAVICLVALIATGTNLQELLLNLADRL